LSPFVFSKLLYVIYTYCSCFICFNNPYFSPSIVVNMVFNDFTSKPKLSIFWLTIALLETFLQFCYFPIPPPLALLHI
jgi:hypothetical protein